MKRARILVGIAVLGGTLGLSASPGSATTNPCTTISNGLAQLEQAEALGGLLTTSQLAQIEAAEAQLQALQTSLGC